MKNNETTNGAYSSYEPDVGSIAEVELGITKLESEIKSGKQKYKVLVSFLGLSIFIAVGFMFFGNLILETFGLIGYAAKAPFYGFTMIGYFLFMAFWIYILKSSRINSLQSDLDLLMAKKRIMSRSALSESTEDKLSYFDRLVEINISNLEAYYKLVKVHTNNSFLSSIAAGTVGFILIGIGLVIGFSAIHEAKYIAYISAGAGILTEFIASIFFYLYNRTVRQLKDYHDSLIDVQNILLSFKIVGDTKDESKQASLMELMLKCLIKIPNK
jgi:hypothetical protein